MVEFLHICCDRIVERYKKSNFNIRLIKIYCTLGEMYCCKDGQISSFY
jgi:hypothetical protein